ncbi:unnamed protein product [Phytomonas sp. EM1]|nr:unnamed protein product [Phytomonas sp. EM1]|eukprot:CCW61053.1 unnamed protein product [Phytomonas sp. isolate EM1]
MTSLTRNEMISNIMGGEERIFTCNNDIGIHKNGNNVIEDDIYGIIDGENVNTRFIRCHLPYISQHISSCFPNTPMSSSQSKKRGKKKRSSSVTPSLTDGALNEIFSEKGAQVGERLLMIARSGLTPLQRIAARRQLVTLGGPYAVLGSGSHFSVWMRPPPLNHSAIAQHTQHFHHSGQSGEYNRNRAALRKGYATLQETEASAFEKGLQPSSCTHSLSSDTTSSTTKIFNSKKLPKIRCAYPLTRAECCAVSLLAMEYDEEDEDAYTVDLTISSPFCSRKGSHSCFSRLTEEHHLINDEYTGKEPLRGTVNEFLLPYTSYHNPSSSYERVSGYDKLLKNRLPKRPNKGFLGPTKTHFTSDHNHRTRVARRLDYTILCDEDLWGR